MVDCTECIKKHGEERLNLCTDMMDRQLKIVLDHQEFIIACEFICPLLHDEAEPIPETFTVSDFLEGKVRVFK